MRVPIADCDECGEGSDFGENLCWDCFHDLRWKTVINETKRIDLETKIVTLVSTRGGIGVHELADALRADGVTYPRATFHAAVSSLTSAGYIERTDRQFHIPVDAMRFDSQVELDFWKGYRRMRPWELRGMLPQHDTGRYRIDFAIQRRKFGIEIDGLRFHDGQDAFMRDRRRQRDLEMDGWRITRFAAKEIMNDVDACIREAAEQARELVIA